MFTLADNVTLGKGRSLFALFYGFAALPPGFSDFSSKQLSRLALQVLSRVVIAV